VTMNLKRGECERLDLKTCRFKLVSAWLGDIAVSINAPSALLAAAEALDGFYLGREVVVESQFFALGNLARSHEDDVRLAVHG